MEDGRSLEVAVIVAHPDDETLWCGGTLLGHPFWNVLVITLCRASDSERAPKFLEAINRLGAEGIMGDLDDSPLQPPLDENTVQESILSLLPNRRYDMVISHHPNGEYTRHLRHEEVSRSVINLWHSGKIHSDVFRAFAYEDGGNRYLPRAMESASVYEKLSKQIWKKKYSIITETYGFSASSFEATTTPKAEAFWQFTIANNARKLLINKTAK